MSLFAASAELTPWQIRRLQELLERFESSWQLVEIDQLYDFMLPFLPPSPDPLRLFSLQDMVASDLQKRWERHLRILLETYQTAIPELGIGSTLSLELIIAEWRTRLRYLDHVALEDYRSRFPSQYPILVRRVSKKSTLREADSTRGDHSDNDFDQLAIANIAEGSSFPLGDRGYRLFHSIGRGVYGEVWKAEAPGGVHVALKIIRWPLAHAATRTEMNALELMKQLRHPFLVQLQAYFLVGDRLYMVMELADQSLAELHQERIQSNEGSFPLEELQRYVCEAAEALDYLHARDILHRDVKPANILLFQGHAKLGDCGLAKLLGKDTVDATSTLIGTPLYMAPEVWQKRVSKLSDQYALAATYYELRLGRQLFELGAPLELMQYHLDSEPDLAGLPAHERQVLQKALSKEPEKRFASCGEFAASLCDAIAADSGPEITANAQPRNRYRTMFTPVLLLILIAALIFLIWPQSVTLSVSSECIEIRAGQHETVKLKLSKRVSRSPKIQIEPTQIEGITVLLAEWDDDTQASNLTITVDLNSAQGQHELTLSALIDGNATNTIHLELSVTPAAVRLPKHFIPAPNTLLISLSADGKKQNNHEDIGIVYYQRIVPELISNELRRDAVFVMIPGDQRDGQILAPFYMMENKVSNRLFETFANSSSHSPLIGGLEWEEGALVNGKRLGIQGFEMYPVFNVRVEDAFGFASWLGGQLPTIQQWDKAAGLFDQEKWPDWTGPFDPDGTKYNSADAPAVSMPVPIDSANQDISPWGVRHMSGNGQEWTRETTHTMGKMVPLDTEMDISSVKLRGREYANPRRGPLTYAQLLQQRATWPYKKEDPAISFRVVVETLDEQ